MSTGMLIVNIVLIAVATAVVAIPAVLIPNLLDRDLRTKTTKPVRQAEPARRWAPEGRRSADAA